LPSTKIGPDPTVINDGKPPKRKTESGGRLAVDEVRSSEGTQRMKGFNIKSGLHRAGKALNEIKGIIINNIKKEATTPGNLTNVS